MASITDAMERSLVWSTRSLKAPQNSFSTFFQSIRPAAISSSFSSRSAVKVYSM
jgi:hypothetical protein